MGLPFLTHSEDVSKRQKGIFFCPWSENRAIHGENLIFCLSIMNTPNNGGAISGMGVVLLLFSFVFRCVAKRNAVAFAPACFWFFWAFGSVFLSEKIGETPPQQGTRDFFLGKSFLLFSIQKYNHCFFLPKKMSPNLFLAFRWLLSLTRPLSSSQEKKDENTTFGDESSKHSTLDTSLAVAIAFKGVKWGIIMERTAKKGSLESFRWNQGCNPVIFNPSLVF